MRRGGKTEVNYAYSFPVKEKYEKSKGQCMPSYPGGEVATIATKPVSKYIRFQLIALNNYDKDDVSSIVWEPYKTNIYNLFGEVIGVARDTAQNNDYLCNPDGLTMNNPGHNGSEGINFLTIYYSNYYTPSTQGPRITDFKNENI
jgi:hypothetical protein